MNNVSDRVDRTRLVFYGAGAVFAAGFWSYLFGSTAQYSPQATVPLESQWDFVSMLPILLSIIALGVLNAFADRTALQTDNNDFFSGGGMSKPARVFVFVMLVVTMCIVGFSMLLAALRYTSERMAMSIGLNAGTVLISVSSMIIFWMRKIEQSFF